jgi:hypothetical protein
MGWNFVYESYGYHNPKPPDLSKVSDPVEKLARLCRNFIFNIHPFAQADSVANPLVETYLRIAAVGRWTLFLQPLISSRCQCRLEGIQDQLQKRLMYLPYGLRRYSIKPFSPAETRQGEAFDRPWTINARQEVQGLDW